MRIEVVGEGTISQQARTYAEYRVFAALTQFSEADKVRTRSRPAAPSEARERLRGDRLHRDGRAEGIGLLSDPQQRAPTHMPQSTARSNASEPTRRPEWWTASLFEACPCHALLRCALRVALLPMVRGAGRSSGLKRTKDVRSDSVSNRRSRSKENRHHTSSSGRSPSPTSSSAQRKCRFRQSRSLWTDLAAIVRDATC